MNMMHEIEPKMKFTSVEGGILTVAVVTLAFAVAGRFLPFSNAFSIILFDAATWVLFIAFGISFLIRNNTKKDLLAAAIAFPIFVFTIFGVMLSDEITEISCKLFGTNKTEIIKILGLGISGIIAFYGFTILNRRAIAQDEANKLTEKGHDQDLHKAEDEKLAKKRAHDQDRFKTAVEHLSNTESESGRIASFYEFYYLAKNAKGNKDDSAQTSPQAILDILCAHLRLIAGAEEYVVDDKNPDLPSITDDKNIKDDKKPKRQKEEINSLIGLLFGEETGTVFSKLKFNFQHVKVNLADVDFSSADLTKMEFSFAHISNADFQNVILCQARFRETIFRNTTFQGADLQGAKLPWADLQGADLQGADLRNANLVNSKLQWTELQWTKWQKAYLLFADLRNADLQNADLRNADLRHANLRGADFQNADLQKADLRGADLRETSFHEKDLQESILYGTRHFRAKRQKTDLWWADFRETKNLKTAQLFGAKYSEGTKFPDDFDPKDYGMNLCPPYNETKEQE